MNAPLSSLQAVVLAAGRSNRFNRSTTKLMEKICGRELIRYPVSVCESLSIPVTLIMGYQKEELITCLTHYGHSFDYALQQEARGTGDALRCALDNLYADTVLVLCGDTPLLAATILEKLIEKHRAMGATISFIISHLDDPNHQYGRVTEIDGRFFITEARDCTQDQKNSCWINAGIYLFNRSFLTTNLELLQPSAYTHEYYVTDLIKIAGEQKLTVSTYSVPFDHVRGINTVQELLIAEQAKKAEIINYWIQQGVQFIDPRLTHIDSDVFIGEGTVIGAGAQILGTTKIGKNCKVGSFVTLENSICEDNVTVDSYSLIRTSTLCMGSAVGPYAHIRDAAYIGTNAVVGNFVEIKKTVMGRGTKAKHLSYLGDATIGDHVNIGAGTITCNHNGVAKNRTIIEDNAYIGSNNSLVAPVTIGKNSYTAAGSTITDDVPDNALAIARAYQVNKKDYR